MHTHDHSERLIYVLEGRGIFHVAPSVPERATDPVIRQVPVRSRDVLLFRRGTMHTFSTASEPLLLLSYHAPFIPLENERQYSVPPTTVLPGADIQTQRSRATCDPGWSRLA